MDPKNKNIKCIYIFPFNYRPEIILHRRFKLFSEWSSGFIFTRSNKKIINKNVANFRLYSVVKKGDSLVHRLNETLQFWYIALKNIWGKEKVDVIVAYDPFLSGLCGLILSIAFRAKLIIEINGDFQTLRLMKKTTLSDGSFLSRLIMRLLLSITTHSASSLKTLNNNTKQHFLNRLPNKPIYCFMGFIQSNFFKNLPSNSGNYLLSVGHPFDLKGMDLIIRAFLLITDKHPHISLHIMGYCPDEQLKYYKKLAENNAKIKFIKPGWIEDVGKQISGCYCYVSASHFEAGGRTIFEALFCKKPIIATRTNGALTYIHDNKNGLLCNIGDVHTLAKKIDFLLSKPHWAKQLGMNGYEIAIKNYDENSYNNKYKKMLHEVSASRK